MLTRRSDGLPDRYVDLPASDTPGKELFAFRFTFDCPARHGEPVPTALPAR